MCETRSFYLWLAQIFLLIGLVVLILWLSLRPKTPTYTVVDLNIPNFGNRTQNTTIVFGLEIKNPNKDYSIYYDDINVVLYHASDSMGRSTIGAFHQGRKRTDHYTQGIGADGRLWNAVLKEILNGTGELRVELVTKFRYRFWGRKSKHHGLQLNGRVPIGKDGKISGKKKKIKLSKIKISKKK